MGHVEGSDLLGHAGGCPGPGTLLPPLGSCRRTWQPHASSCTLCRLRGCSSGHGSQGSCVFGGARLELDPSQSLELVCVPPPSPIPSPDGRQGGMRVPGQCYPLPGPIRDRNKIHGANECPDTLSWVPCNLKFRDSTCQCGTLGCNLGRHPERGDI